MKFVVVLALILFQSICAFGAMPGPEPKGGAAMPPGSDALSGPDEEMGMPQPRHLLYRYQIQAESPDQIAGLFGPGCQMKVLSVGSGKSGVSIYQVYTLEAMAGLEEDLPGVSILSSHPLGFNGIEDIQEEWLSGIVNGLILATMLHAAKTAEGGGSRSSFRRG